MQAPLPSPPAVKWLSHLYYGLMGCAQRDGDWGGRKGGRHPQGAALHLARAPLSFRGRASDYSSADSPPTLILLLILLLQAGHQRLPGQGRLGLPSGQPRGVQRQRGGHPRAAGLWRQDPGHGVHGPAGADGEGLEGKRAPGVTYVLLETRLPAGVAAPYPLPYGMLLAAMLCTTAPPTLLPASSNLPHPALLPPGGVQHAGLPLPAIPQATLPAAAAGGQEAGVSG